jgi:hypothetical protein
VQDLFKNEPNGVKVKKNKMGEKKEGGLRDIFTIALGMEKNYLTSFS